MRLLATDAPVQSAYYGFMFSVHASEDVEVTAVHAMSEVNMRVEATVYSANGSWEDLRAKKSAWKGVGSGQFKEVTRVTYFASK